MSRLRLVGRIVDRWSPIVAIGCILVGFMVLHNQGQALHQTQQQLAASNRNQIINRAANVETWCEGDNAGYDYNRRFVAGFRLRYTLADLPCEDLIRQTLESPKRKEPVTAESNPITFRLAKRLGVQR